MARPAPPSNRDRFAALRAALTPRTLAIAAAIVVPLFGATRAGEALADALGERAGATLASASAALPAAPTSSRDAAPEATRVDEPAPVAPSSSSSVAPSRGASGLAKKPPPKGVLVRAALVARAVRAGARPSGSPVPATSLRPAGVALSGVSQHGSGLADGDVVTEVGGTKTTSVQSVIVAVAGAVRSGARGISAVVWRGDTSFPVTVEIPVIEPLPAADAGADGEVATPSAPSPGPHRP